jgi:hypothetical protein
MDIEKLLDNINRVKQHGDSIRIARMVNEKRQGGGEKPISPSYVNLMLRNKRTMTEELAEVADRYFKVQVQLLNN